MSLWSLNNAHTYNSILRFTECPEVSEHLGKDKTSLEVSSCEVKTLTMVHVKKPAIWKLACLPARLSTEMRWMQMLYNNVLTGNGPFDALCLLGCS